MFPFDDVIMIRTQCREMIDHVNTSLYFLNEIQRIIFPNDQTHHDTTVLISIVANHTNLMKLETKSHSLRLNSTRPNGTVELNEHENDDVIKWKYLPRYWPFVRGIHRSPVNSPQKGQWRGAFILSLLCACINGWVNNREAGDLRRHRGHYDIIVMV